VCGFGLLVCPQDAPAQTAKAIATANSSDLYHARLAGVITEGLAQRGAGANALAEALGQAYKQVRRQCMKLLLGTWLAVDSECNVAALKMQLVPLFG
jgi:hypothetical protein